ncbi:hypothetical protein [Mesorhizobium salmacidum]|uniref:Uncharacterized protein n=1 Tax=Mesorhizobium salmacidum TaxID=3015171 RepID=A0ABU8L2U1_9HYPH
MKRNEGLVIVIVTTLGVSGFRCRRFLKARSGFRKRVEKGGVYTAIGYSASNVTVSQAEGSPIILHTSASPVDAVRSSITTIIPITPGRFDGCDAFGTALPYDQFINAGTQLKYGGQARRTQH